MYRNATQDAATLVAEADLAGADAHGIFRLPQYIEWLEAGSLNPKADISVNRTALATASVDGDNASGSLSSRRSAEAREQLYGIARRT